MGGGGGGGVGGPYTWQGMSFLSETTPNLKQGFM